jgi:hypothetical protein
VSGRCRFAGPAGALEFDRSTYHYKSRRSGQAALEQRIKEICHVRVRYGYRGIHIVLRREGWHHGQNKSSAFLRAVRKSMRPVRVAIGAAAINLELLTCVARQSGWGSRLWEHSSMRQYGCPA